MSLRRDPRDPPKVETRRARIAARSTTSVKDQAREIVDRLPDDATSDELMYRIYVCQKIEDGIRAGEEGRVMSHEEVKKRFLAKAP